MRRSKCKHHAELVSPAFCCRLPAHSSITRCDRPRLFRPVRFLPHPPDRLICKLLHPCRLRQSSRRDRIEGGTLPPFSSALTGSSDPLLQYRISRAKLPEKTRSFPAVASWPAESRRKVMAVGLRCFLIRALAQSTTSRPVPHESGSRPAAHRFRMGKESPEVAEGLRSTL